MLLLAYLALWPCSVDGAAARIDRRDIVRDFNVYRWDNSRYTPLQVGNGNFAFGVDVTGLQTFKPFATMSTWGWHNFSLPSNRTSIESGCPFPFFFLRHKLLGR